MNKKTELTEEKELFERMKNVSIEYHEMQEKFDRWMLEKWGVTYLDLHSDESDILLYDEDISVGEILEVLDYGVDELSYEDFVRKMDTFRENIITDEEYPLRDSNEKFCECGEKVRHRKYNSWTNTTYFKCPNCGKRWRVRDRI